jgi:uncharacterized protein YfbU (UPF0304 family)
MLIERRRMEVVDVMDQLNPKQKKLLNSITSKIENVYKIDLREIDKLTTEELKFILDLEQLYNGVEEIDWLKDLASKVNSFMKTKIEDENERI